MNTLFPFRIQVGIIALCVIIGGALCSPVWISAQQQADDTQQQTDNTQQQTDNTQQQADNARAQASNIHIAVLEGDYEAVERFLDAGVSPDSYNSTGFAPLHSAARAGRVDIVDLLLAYGGDVNVQSRTTIDPEQAGLHIAARNGYLELIEFLLENGADPNIQDSRGNTPLHDAAISGDRSITRTLVLGGADVAVRNTVGDDVLAVASGTLDRAVFSRTRVAIPITISPQLDFDDLSGDIITGIINGLLRTDFEIGLSVLFPIGDSDLFIGPEVAVGLVIAPLFTETLIIRLPLRIVMSAALSYNSSVDALIGAELNVRTGGRVQFTDLTFDVGLRLDADGLLIGAYYTLPFAVPFGTPQFTDTSDAAAQAYAAEYWQNALSLVFGYRIKL